MARKKSKKRASSKKTSPSSLSKGSSTSSSKKSEKPSKVEERLIENFVALQKVMVNLSVKFDNLATQISKLLELFDISAKALAKKEINLGTNKKELEEIKDKLNEISGQNKIIAKGLALLHEKEPLGLGQETSLKGTEEKQLLQVPQQPPVLHSSSSATTPSNPPKQEQPVLPQDTTLKQETPQPTQQQANVPQPPLTPPLTSNPGALIPPSQEKDGLSEQNPEGEEFHRSIYNPHEQPKQFKKLPKV